MKKIFFLLGIVFISSLNYSQNVTVVNQTGDEHVAKVAQINGDQNLATVDQFGGNNNYIDVISDGNKNNVDVDQNGSIINSKNEGIYGYVHQTGDENDSKLQQIGTHIDFKIDQINGNNKAIVNQVGDWLQLKSHGLVQIREGGEAGNEAILTQEVYAQTLNVIQRGTGNKITSLQHGNFNQYSAFQTGALNIAQIKQLGDNNWDGQESTILNKLTQSGEENQAYITQNGNSKFLVDQLGNYNLTGLELTGSLAKVWQEGNHNVVGGLMNCVPTPVAVFLDGSSLDAFQYGDYNKLFVSTAGTLTTIQNNLGTALIGNLIKYNQTNAGGATLTQIGDENLIWLKNTSANNPMNVDIDQIGNGNTVATFVNGIVTSCGIFAGSHLDVDQIGNNNSLNLESQSGAEVHVLQQGNNNWASVIQN